MELKKVWAMYFSPTGGTEKAVKTTAQVVAEKLNLPLEIYDFTLPQGREKDAVFGEGDLVVCGTPVIAGRVPNVLLPYLTEKVKGNGAYAVPVVSFGNRNYDDALIEGINTPNFLMKKYAYFCYAPKTKIRRKVLIYRGFSLFCNSFQRRGRVLNLFSLFPYISAY